MKSKTSGNLSKLNYCVVVFCSDVLRHRFKLKSSIEGSKEYLNILRVKMSENDAPGTLKNKDCQAAAPACFRQWLRFVQLSRRGENSYAPTQGCHKLLFPRNFEK